MNPSEHTQKPKRTLRNIVDELLQAIDDAGGEVTDSIDLLGVALEDKVQAYAVVYRQLEAESGAMRELAKAYMERASRKQLQADQLKQRLHAEMQRLGVTKLKTPTVSVFEKVTKCVEIADAEMFVERHGIHSEYVRASYSPNKTAIREDIEKNDALVNGAELVTHTSLQFR